MSLLKARTLADRLARDGVGDAAVLSDDSGLEVDALQGRPGVLSARYAGARAAWPQRRAALLAELGGVGVAQRRARFVCVMTLIVPNRELLASIGVVEGTLTEADRGASGFGYDPLFYYPPLKSTFAELSFEEKSGYADARA
jgi:XTP/dITP diphosphohydrolase